MKKTYEEVEVTHLSNGEKVTFGVHKYKGAAEGPIVGISGAVHGDELIGAEIIRRVAKELENYELKGQVWLIPIVNQLAFENVTRNTPLDMNNLNRVFPGDEKGWITDQLAFKFTKEILEKIDAFIDIHAGGKIPIVDYVYIHNDEGLSKAFLSPYLYRPAISYEGTTATVTTQLNIPSVTIEIGGGPNYEKDIKRGVEGIINQLVYLKVIEGEVKTVENQVVLTEIASIRPTQGGMLVPAFDFSYVNKVIEGPQTIAEIYNPKTFELLETIKAPFEKNVMILMRGYVGTVNSGDYGWMLGNMESKEND
ncbi:succinylglutamate desuccinylase/aspartoacylase family protein [Bacillus ndiopicus]|uniref:succinylglutamate desuccinylase/aspartoacylase family protein n=1 Tax=Bacillus ndiopicus TaxID=1347368 RepID=UPI0005A88E50|nr:succinylglutamate desuccinylase/aspartoacylase family protein [Bacillus ndiopicus]